MSQPCPFCHATLSKVKNYGHFVRRSDQKKVYRYKCTVCLKSFSDAYFDPNYRQRKRYLHKRILDDLCGGKSQRRTAKNLKISRTTVHRKIILFGRKARKELKAYWGDEPCVAQLEFDDMETFEHTKCKPLSLTIAVEKKTRKIVGLRVSRFAAKGRLSKIAKVKYGFRKDERERSRNELFEELRGRVLPDCCISSDMSPHYPKAVRKWFPKAAHKTTKGRRGCVVGQGELKRGGYDPIFTLNHTYGMFRDNLKRLTRQTWCTTKDPARLEDLLYIYSMYHNLELTPARANRP